MTQRKTILFVLAVLLLNRICEAEGNPGVPLGLPPLKLSTPATPSVVELGRRLFNDRRLSADGTVGCVTCHSAARAFSDGLPQSRGYRQQRGTRNAPSLFNVAFQSSLFWDGRVATLELQARAPLTNSIEHAFPSLDAWLAAVRTHREYASLSQAAFGANLDDITVDQLTTALSAFERTLLAANSPFDRFLYARDSRDMSPSAIRGFEIFDHRAHCTVCHQIGEKDALFTDGKFHMTPLGLGSSVSVRLKALTDKVIQIKQTGTPADFERLIATDSEVASLGRYLVTFDPQDIGHYKTPSLRDVALTAPYMHDGSVATLEAAVKLELYGRDDSLNYPIALTVDEQHDLVEFLRSLTSNGLERVGIH